MEIYNESVRDLLSDDTTPLRLLDDPEVNLFHMLKISVCMNNFLLNPSYLTERDCGRETYRRTTEGLGPLPRTFFCL